MTAAEASAFDLAAPRAVHIVGVGGAGMSGIAMVLSRMGHRVSGSDLGASAVLDRLSSEGVAVHVGHQADHLPAEVDAVVLSTAIPADNPEALEAHRRGVPVLRRAQALRLITESRRTVAISGTHGKTTTSAMVALVLRQAGWRPTFLVGGDIHQIGGNAAYDEGEWLVVEADESDSTFLELAPEAVVVTNIEADHLDHFGGLPAIVDAFRRFILGATKVAVVCADDPEAGALAEETGAVTYGFSALATYRIEEHEAGGGGSRFRLTRAGGPSGAIELGVPGRHNVLNAAGAAAVALELGVPFEVVSAALAAYAGVARRFETKGVLDGVTIVDDYAHLPAEVKAVLAAAREGDWSRVVAVFQPHRYSRTEALWRDFGDAFADADVVVLTDVYAAGETPRPGVSGRLILQAVLDARPSARVLYLPTRADLVRTIPGLLRQGDLLLTLGAGDITSLAGDLLGAATPQ